MPTLNAGNFDHVLVESAISNTASIINQIQLLTIILFKMIFINDIFFGLVIWHGSQDLSSNVIIQRPIFLFDRKSIIDIWNILLVCVFSVLC